MLREQADVETSATAGEAVEKAKSKKFDVLIVDINLGIGGSGFDVLKTLRQDTRYRTTPMIACTAFAVAGDEERFLNAGFDAYLAKPFERDELRQLIRKLTTDHREDRGAKES